MRTNDTPILDLMKDIDKGNIQLPDFQRGWVWDDSRIRGLIASITQNFPVGAAMFLEYGNANVRFKYRMIEGAPSCKAQPEQLILDGQQRLTSIYASMCSPNAIKTRTDKGNEIKRFYYIDIAKAIDPAIDRVEAIISVPESKRITSDFGRKIDLDVSTAEREYANKLFPLNIILDDEKSFEWERAYLAYHSNSHEASDEYRTFRGKIIMTVTHYKIPVISLDKDTPKEAVCQVFENVNQGGVSLTVFELVIAVFAMDDFELRKDWEKRKNNHLNGDILNIVTATDFLTACTLLSAYEKKGVVSCKKKDVLNLKLADYQKYADVLMQGFEEAEMLLFEERIFVSRDLPYTTQLIPLAVLCALLLLDRRIKNSNVKNKIKRWYWCGVFGELYGSANETRYVNDVVGVMNWLNGGELPKTIVDSYFNPMRLLMLQSRRSAAYKGIMALIMKNHSRDFISGQEMDLVLYKAAGIDIHHIFPKNYCKSRGYDYIKWDSIINKTPLSYSTNREIGGVAPSEYLARIEKKKVEQTDLCDYLASHWIDMADCMSDDFERFIVHRARKILDAIANVTGKPISGRDSDEVREKFDEIL
ncbi:DUF262 domain-containing protein [Selenomonas sputigena]|uniref:GmrSD restriction endonuclease domain-containing protein n=1 Tax=Selenomonas sputigena TaxID=69823 RepID=UPI0022343DEE|nr:DUF262 domain-containing protein [Selenomonas sputigena]UZE45684.1 DUF262 domain-containing protein [Selenomonas sputigena]